jgi:alpha-L-arabinofuranosidase
MIHLQAFYTKPIRLILAFSCLYSMAALCNQPDSAYIFAYATDKSLNKNGLYVAWSIDQGDWHPIGPEYSYLKCDYGNWGTEKRMISPILLQDAENTWHCLWSVNATDGVFAHSASKDLVEWGPQTYPIVMKKGNCLLPQIAYDKKNNEYIITWLSVNEADTVAYSTTTRDFTDYSPSQKIPVSSRQNLRRSITISGKTESGTMHKVAWKVIDNLIKAQQLAAYAHILSSENAHSDYIRFSGLGTVNAAFTLDNPKRKKISNSLIGVFFEDINYAADGGLYAELIQNRGFEYSLNDKKGNDKTWTHTRAWKISGENASLTIDSLSPVHPNNKYYAILETGEKSSGLINKGFDGIPIEAGEKYDFSVFARTMDGRTGTLKMRLIGRNGEIYGESGTLTISGDWQKYNAVLIAKKTVTDANLEIVPQIGLSIALDMVSLFPRNTYKGRKNGLRPDLAQAIAGLKPRFVRFPGGCIVHGDGLANIYRWKNTIGPLEARKPQRNLWGYHQSYGLGFFEYFQFCEDIGAEPLPVVAAGVPCQNSSTGGAGQQGGIPMSEMDSYVQDVLDLVEYANGDTTTTWGKKRADAGHPEPFNLKYLGIGNEDLISHIFEERFTLIYDALKEKYPEITVIGTAGPFSEGADYKEGWRIANKLQIPIVDEHYYKSPGWFINNQDFYDKYDRSGSRVYLGEYASWGNTLYNALAEAIYLTAIERNGDVVIMSSYAPLLAKENHIQWTTDLIFFNNTEVKPTVNYYIQQLFSQHAGDIYIPYNIILSDNHDGVRERIAASVVQDSESNDIIVKLINILPVAVNSAINLKDFNIYGDEAEATLLKGEPDEQNLSPEKFIIPVSDTIKAELPPYSFTVIRIKTK